ncbi:hypothetical protein [Staphylococcus warneri]|uniref:hypothetical protein n=1 Tax=Staphylococcus warneri TaxID=1292 RepID=UPI002557887C|nr:hypothetical protein [Staphylococcus warneri]MDK8170785.1 hypothetical protein [Staphylococcus warneri]
MFKKFFTISVVLFAIDMLSIVFKDSFLLGEKTTTMNGFLLFLTILFTISMIVTTFFYFISKKNHNTEEYKGLYFTVLISLPFVWLIVGHIITSPLPYILK